MKVFISWSGNVSEQVALVLRDWLPNVIQVVEPFVSSEDIERGTRWLKKIETELENVNFGILCITSENMNRPWILFEAGALSKSIDQARVIPLLINIRPADLKGPLAQFNATSIERSAVLQLVKTINGQLGNAALNDAVIERTYEKWWPDLETSLQEIINEADNNNDTKEAPERSDHDILEEVLELTRFISKRLTNEMWSKSLEVFRSADANWAADRRRLAESRVDPALAAALGNLSSGEQRQLRDRVLGLLGGNDGFAALRGALNAVASDPEHGTHTDATNEENSDSDKN